MTQHVLHRCPTVVRQMKVHVQAGIWEPLDPWLFLDKEELRCVRESCWDNCRAVDTFTPFPCFRQDCGPGVEEESELDEG